MCVRMNRNGMVVRRNVNLVADDGHSQILLWLFIPPYVNESGLHRVHRLSPPSGAASSVVEEGIKGDRERNEA
jgi:hypothetical protein